METILREVLAEDRSLLCRRDELTAALEKKVPPDKSRDFAAIKRALSLNVGEKFFVGEDSDREATKTEVAKILKEGGLQEARINFVVDAFVKALDWDKPKVSVPEKTDAAPAKEPETKNITEIFKQAKDEQQPPPPKPSPPKPSPPKPPKPKIPPKPSPIKPPPKPAPPQQASANQSSDNKKILIGVACVAVLALGFMVGRSSTPTTPTTPLTSSASNVQQAEPSQNLQPPPPEDTSYLNAQTDLSLNGVDLGASAETLVLKWGEPNQRERHNDGNFTYVYDTINVGMVEEKVDAFMTKDPKYRTKRGLHVGSDYSEVVDKYGTNSKDMTVEGLVLHEYPFTSLDGKNSLLRFAVNSSGRVEYISIRVVEQEAPKKNTENPDKNDSGIDKNTEQAALAFLRFHEAITDKNYSAAFDLFSDERKENMNYDVRAFAKGYSNTIASEITDLKLVSTSDNHVVMDYVLDARDRTDGGRTLYQQFRGQVEMIKAGGEWKIAATKSKRIKENMER